MYYLRDLQVQNRVNRLVKTTKQTGITIIRISTALFYYKILCLYYTNRMVFIEPNESKNIIELYSKQNYEDLYLLFDMNIINSQFREKIKTENIFSIRNNSNYYVTLYNGTLKNPYSGTFINLKDSVSNISNYTDNIAFTGLKVQLLTSSNITFNTKMQKNVEGYETVVPEKDENIHKIKEEIASYQTLKDNLTKETEDKNNDQLQQYEKHLRNLKYTLQLYKKEIVKYVRLFTENDFIKMVVEYDLNNMFYINYETKFTKIEQIRSIENTADCYVTLYNGTLTDPFSGTYVVTESSISDISNYADNIEFTGAKFMSKWLSPKKPELNKTLYPYNSESIFNYFFNSKDNSRDSIRKDLAAIQKKKDDLIQMSKTITNSDYTEKLTEYNKNIKELQQILQKYDEENSEGDYYYDETYAKQNGPLIVLNSEIDEIKHDYAIDFNRFFNKDVNQELFPDETVITEFNYLLDTPSLFEKDKKRIIDIYERNVRYLTEFLNKMNNELKEDPNNQTLIKNIEKYKDAIDYYNTMIKRFTDLNPINPSQLQWMDTSDEIYNIHINKQQKLFDELQTCRRITQEDRDKCTQNSKDQQEMWLKNIDIVQKLCLEEILAERKEHEAEIEQKVVYEVQQKINEEQQVCEQIREYDNEAYKYKCKIMNKSINERLKTLEQENSDLKSINEQLKTLEQENSDLKQTNTTFTYTVLFFISVVSVLVFIYMIYRWRTV